MKKGLIALLAVVFLVMGCVDAAAQKKASRTKRRTAKPSVSMPCTELQQMPPSHPYGENSDYPVSMVSGIGNGQGSGVGSGGMGTGQGTGAGNGGKQESRVYLPVNLGETEKAEEKKPEPPKPTTSAAPCTPSATEPLRLISKPRAMYTDKARVENVQGTVRLRVTFLASGAIGAFTPVSGLPFGLTERAVAAARQIRFEPAKKNGVPQRTIKTIEYVFTIY